MTENRPIDWHAFVSINSAPSVANKLHAMELELMELRADFDRVRVQRDSARMQLDGALEKAHALDAIIELRQELALERSRTLTREESTTELNKQLEERITKLTSDVEQVSARLALVTLEPT